MKKILGILAVMALLLVACNTGKESKDDSTCCDSLKTDTTVVVDSVSVK